MLFESWEDKANRESQKVIGLLSRGPEIFSNWYERNKDKIGDSDPIIEYIKQNATKHLYEVYIESTSHTVACFKFVLLYRVNLGQNSMKFLFGDYSNWAIVYYSEWWDNQNTKEQQNKREKEAQEKWKLQRDIEEQIRREEEQKRTTEMYKQQAKQLFH